jgi:cell division septum initiation protein DivIVA
MNKNYLQEVEDLKVQLEEVQRELEQYKNRVKSLADSMADYRAHWMTVC